MSKLIIDLRTDKIDMEEALIIAGRVVGEGKVSGEGDKMQYCYHMVFRYWNAKHGDLIIGAGAFKNKQSDRLAIYEYGMKEE